MGDPVDPTTGSVSHGASPHRIDAEATPFPALPPEGKTRTSSKGPDAFLPTGSGGQPVQAPTNGPGQLGQRVLPQPVVTPAALPITIDSPHCVGSTVEDLQSLFQQIQANPEVFAQGLQSNLLPGILDHGTHEIEFGARMNPGTYRGGIRVEGPTMVFARLRIVDGRLNGELRFLPRLVRSFGPLDVNLNAIRIETGDDGRIRFIANATFLEIDAPASVATEDVSEMLLGQRLSSIEGPASRLIQQIMAHSQVQRPENLVDLSTARFAIRVNPRPEDPASLNLGQGSSVRANLDRLQITPHLALTDIHAGIEIRWNPETGGFRVLIPEARIGRIRQDPGTACGPDPNVGTNLDNIRLQNVALDLAPTADRRALGDALYHRPETAMYLRSATGTIQTGEISLNRDLIVSANEGANAIRFNITGQPNGDLAGDVTIPRILADMPDGSNLTLGGQLLQNQTARIHVDDTALASGQFHFDLQGGRLAFNGQIAPSVRAADVEQRDASGQLVVGANAMGFQCEPITFRREMGSDVTRIHVPDCDLNSSAVRLVSGLPALGTANLGFNNLGADILVSPTGVSVDRFQFPDFIFSSDTTMNGVRTTTRIVDGPAGTRPSGLALQRDSETGPTSTATINTRVERVRFEIPGQGTFEMTGQLTGKAQVVDLAVPVAGRFTPPELRPTVGHLSLRLNGTVRQVSGGSLRLSGSSISISDNGRGLLTLEGNTDVRGVPAVDRVDNARVRIRANLSGNVHRLERPGQTTIAYYDLDPSGSNAISLPQILLGATVPGVGDFGVNGRGRVWGLPNDPHYSATFPLGRQRIDINNAERGISARIDMNGGSLTARGDLRTATLNLQPPRDVNVHFTQEVTGVTYTYDGTLHSRSSIQANVNFRRQRLSFRERGGAPQLTGDLTVTATRRQEDGTTTTLGSGRVQVSTRYQVSGDLGTGSGEIRLRVPETGLTGEVTSAIAVGNVTIPQGTRFEIPIHGFEGRINLNPRTQTFTSTWTAGDIGPATVRIPRLTLPSGIDVTDVTAEFSAIANGQQWEVSRNTQGQVSFRALAGTDGSLPPFQIQLGAHDGDGQGLQLTVGSTSTATGIGGTVDPATGEVVLDVTGMRLSSTTNGRVRINGEPLELSNITTEAGLPMLQVRINQQTGALRLTARPPQPTGITEPPTDLDSWMQWTTDQWRAYQTQMNATQHLAVLSESIMNSGPVGDFLPQGRGRVYLDLPELDLTANLNDPASLSRILAEVRSGLVMRREFPNPPPRRGEGEPIWLNDAQRPLYRTTEPPGTLFFIRRVAPNGQLVTDPDMERNLEEALGIPRPQVDRIVKSGRIEMDELVAHIRRDLTIAAAIDVPTLADLVTSYLQDSGGSFRRFSQRMILTLANIRRSVPPHDRAPGLLGTDAQGRRPIGAHQFGDPSYHHVAGANDGTDMQFVSMVPAGPDQVAEVLTTRPTSFWDPWISEANASGTIASGDRRETGSLLDHNYDVSIRTSRDGNIRVVRLTSTGQGSMAAGSRTVRVVPLSGGRSLVIWDQHEDFTGTEAELRWPRMRMPDRPRFNIDTVGPSLLGILNPSAPDIGRFYANRFAQTSQRLLEIATGRSIDGVAYTTPNAISRTDLTVDFLALNTEDAANPVLRISPDAAPGTVRRQLTGRLRIPETVANGWISQGRIPLQDLMRETHLNDTFALPVFQATAQVLLGDPQPEADTMRHFTARTERFLILVEDLMHTAELRQAQGSGYSARIREMRDSRFHQRSTEQINDVVDTFMYWYVPRDLGATPENITWFVHHANLFPNYDGNFTPSREIPRSEIPGADPNRTYVETGVNVDVIGEMHYRISVPNDPLTLAPGNVLFSPWRQEDRTGGNRDFLDNQGWWLTLPLADNSGYVVVRAGVINTRLPADRDPTAARTAAQRVVGFMPNVLRAALEHGGTQPGREIPSYSMGSVVQAEISN